MQSLPQSHFNFFMGNKMKSVFKYTNDTYGFTTWLFVGSYDDMTQWLQKKFKYAGNDQQVKNHYAEAFQLSDDQGVVCGHFIWMPSFDFTCRDYGVLVHETLHVAVQALSDRNVIAVLNGESEALNYLQEVIFEKLLVQLNKERKKEENDRL